MDYLSNDKMNIINYPLIKPWKQAKIGGFFMQKNKSIAEVPLEKQEFVDIICRLKDSTELVDKVDELFRNSRENLESACTVGYPFFSLYDATIDEYQIFCYPKTYKGDKQNETIIRNR